MNECDSDYLAQSLILSGLRRADDLQHSDLVLVNTCAVRAKPEQKAFSLIGRLSEIKRKKPNLIIGVIGCLAQKQGKELMERFPYIDIVMGPREIGHIVDITRRACLQKEKVVATDLESPPAPVVYGKRYFNGRISGFISIMEGCNNFCSYCVVPYVRGREISRSPDDVMNQLQNLTSEGVRDITLLGQNVNSYSFTHADKKHWNFPQLLRSINDTEGLLRLRFTTSHPKDLSDELVRCFTDLEKLCPHIHLPFQAGSNSVLKNMKRGYSREQYLELIEKLRSVRPDIAITSDVMVGFPGETEADFIKTLDLIKSVGFDSLFSFKYSDREGTLAFGMEPKIDESEKTSRLKLLQDLQKNISLRKNREFEGKKVEVLVEGESKREGQSMGRTRQNKIVNFNSKYNLLGKLVDIKIQHGLLNSLRGELIRK